MDYSTLFKEVYHNGDEMSLEYAIQKIKDNGAAQIDCVKIVKQELGLTIAEADSLILNSKAWQQERKDIKDFRDHYGSILEELDRDLSEDEFKEE